MRVDRIVVHIGMHKTGSSSMQAVLARNRRSLAQRGVFGLLAHENHSLPVVMLFADRPERFAQVRVYGLHRPLRRAVYRGLARLDLGVAVWRARGRTLVLSGEDIGLLQPAELERLRAWLAARARRVTVLGFVRPPVSFMNSAAQQRLRSGTTLDELARRPPRPAYRERFEKFFRLFGPDRVTLRLWSPDATGDQPGPLAAFLGEVGAGGDAAERLGSLRQNTGLSLEAGRLLDAANRAAPALRNGRPNPRRALSLSVDLADYGGRPFTLNAGLLDATIRAEAADIAWMSATLGTDVADLDAGICRHTADEAGGPDELLARARARNAAVRRRERRRPALLLRRVLVYGLGREVRDWFRDDGA